MPTYEYACKACGERLEVVQSFSDAALTECPACGGDLRKVFSPVGIAFKGSGFYKTDSRSGSKKTTTASSSGDSTKSDSSSSKSDSSSSSSTASSSSSSSSSDSSGSKAKTSTPGTAAAS